MILTMSHWSSGLTCLLPATRVTGSNPLGGYLCETGILLLALSRYILHFVKFFLLATQKIFNFSIHFQKRLVTIISRFLNCMWERQE
jgi:hypothetical protein